MTADGSERVERQANETRAVEDMRDALLTLFAVGRDVGALSLQTAERQLDAAIRVSERVRDDLLDTPARERARRQEGLVARLRQDAHRVVDVVADLGVYFLERGAVTVAPPSPPTSALESNVRVVEGIGEKYAARLAAAGIHRCGQLLEAGATRQGRAALAEKSGISAERLLTWINHIDLFRIDGVGAEYAGLLETAGVDSVPELAQRNPQNLHATLHDVNEKAGEVRRLPGVDQVAGWIRQAQALPRVVTH